VPIEEEEEEEECFMLANFFRRSTWHKQRGNKKQNVEIDSAVSGGGEGKYMKYASFL
jgi:hypothetical protein